MELAESFGIVEWAMKGIAFVMDIVSKGIDWLIDKIIWLVNAISEFLGLELGIEVEDTATTEEREAERAENERLAAEAGIDKDSALGQELDFGETKIVDTDATTSPTTVPETGTDGGGTGGGYGSGGSATNGPLSITIYITAMLDDVINTESFAEYVAQYAMAEVAKTRGTGMI
jgi:hypothetical protein